VCARVPSPSGFTPRRAECRDFPGPAQRRLAQFFCARPRTLFHILPPLVECRILSCNCPISNRFSQRSALGFFGMNDLSPLLIFSLPACRASLRVVIEVEDFECVFADLLQTDLKPIPVRQGIPHALPVAT
jgi:hypothetical protein